VKRLLFFDRGDKDEEMTFLEQSIQLRKLYPNIVLCTVNCKKDKEGNYLRQRDVEALLDTLNRENPSRDFSRDFENYKFAIMNQYNDIWLADSGSLQDMVQNERF
jgi:hypothetical protein